MAPFVMSLLWITVTFWLQMHVLPIWGLGAWTPDLTMAAVMVMTMCFGPYPVVPLAFLLGLAMDILFGYGYGMYLIPLTVAALVSAALRDLSFNKPWVAATLTGGAALLARLFRQGLEFLSGRSGAFTGADWGWAFLCAAATAVAAMMILWQTDRYLRSRLDRRWGD